MTPIKIHRLSQDSESGHLLIAFTKMIGALIIVSVTVGLPLLLVLGLVSIASDSVKPWVWYAFIFGGGLCFLFAMSAAAGHRDEMFGQLAFPVFMAVAGVATFLITLFVWGLAHAFAGGEDGFMRGMGILVVIVYVVTTGSILMWGGTPKAKLTAHIVDESGQPISGVNATFWFSGQFQQIRGMPVSGLSDANGNFTAAGHTPQSVSLGITKDGYYKGWDSIPFSQKDERLHRWLPWNASYTAQLRKIENPIPMYARGITAVLPVPVGTPCGYDLEQADWVAPFGTGKVADFLVTITNFQYQNYNNNEASATITFPSPDDGIQQIELPKEFANSAFKWPREAPETGYQPKLEFHHKWSMSGASTIMFNSSNGVDGYFFRVRTVTVGNKIVSALYGRINGGVGAAPNRDGKASIGFNYYLNPTPDDRNMEYNPKQDLFDKLFYLDMPRDP